MNQQDPQAPKSGYGLDVGIPESKQYDCFDVGDHIEDEIVKHHRSGSECGFGYRALEFTHFKTFEEAVEVRKAVVAYLRTITGQEVETDEAHPMSQPGAVDDDNAYAVVYDLAQQAYEEQLARQCAVGFTMGSAHDPYGVQCAKDSVHHEDPQFNDQHVGHHPLADPDEHRVIVWQGGGSCQGDPLPRYNTRSAVWEAEAEYFKNLGRELDKE